MTLKAIISVAAASASLFAFHAFGAPPDNAGPKPMQPYQDQQLGNFSASSVELNFGNPSLAGEYLMVEYVSATITTDPGSIQEVVRIKVLEPNWS